MKLFIATLITGTVLGILADNMGNDTAILLALSLIIASLIVKD